MNFLGEHLLSTVNKHLGRTYSRKEALKEAMGVLIAGSQVTQHTFLYLLFAISRSERQEVQQRLREELSSAGDTLPALMKLPYLTAVIRETYRLYSAIMSTLPRILNRMNSYRKGGLKGMASIKVLIWKICKQL
ncbi:hypothetical protein BKA63DRAFT_194469 [Paraphoma chrysanthemicola]|nr:hypothetical protein BKA63DRAFT_194469 [Paraphoma chrysanthemicola]